MNPAINGNSHKDPARLEREIDEQRQDISETLRALEEKFSSREIADQVLHYFGGHSREWAQSLSGSLKANPIPALLTVVGVTWLMMGERNSPRENAGELREKASSAGEAMRSRAASARDGLAHSAASVRNNFEHMTHEQPLALGAVGIALGALVGAALPRTEQENRLMGRSSERAKQKGAEMAREGYEKAAQKADEVGESLRHL